MSTTALSSPVAGSPAAGDTYQLVSLADVGVDPGAVRATSLDADFALAESIRAAGGLIAPLVLAELEAGSRIKHRFRLIAGHRRRRALIALKDGGLPLYDGLTRVPAIVVRVADEAALQALRLAENRDRAAMHPLEEMELFQEIAKHAGGVPGILKVTGVSEAEALRRLSLSRLSPAARKLFAENEIAVGHALVLARYDAKSQDRLVALIRQRRGALENVAGLSVRAFEKLCADGNARLKTAPFDRNDATLVPAAGACGTCEKRSDRVASLFPDMAAGADDGSALCLDVACFEKKSQAALAAKVAEVRGSGGDVVFVIADALTWHEEKALAKRCGKGAVVIHAFDAVAATPKCTKVATALCVAGDGSQRGWKAGQVTAVCRAKNCAAHRGGAARHNVEPMTAADRARRLLEKRRRLMLGLAVEVAATGPLGKRGGFKSLHAQELQAYHRALLRFLVGRADYQVRRVAFPALGWLDGKGRIADGAAIAARISGLKSIECQRAIAAVLLVGGLQPWAADFSKVAAHQVAALHGIDLGALVRKAAAAIPASKPAAGAKVSKKSAGKKAALDPGGPSLGKRTTKARRKAAPKKEASA